MPLDCEIKIEKDSPVRLLNAVMERTNYSKLYAAYSRQGRIEYSPKILLKIMVYGYMRRQTSSRALEACCRENMHFMYLLEGQPAPDHNTINRFRKNVLSQEAGQNILHQLVRMLQKEGLLSHEAAFIDGTKIEANANKYRFVWKKGTSKKMEKLLAKIHTELPEKLKEIKLRFYVPEKGKLLRVNRSIQAEGNFAFVKQDLEFRRFLLRGNAKVSAEWLLLSLALNVLRLHHKIQKNLLGSGLVVPSSFPAGL